MSQTNYVASTLMQVPRVDYSFCGHATMLNECLCSEQLYVFVVLSSYCCNLDCQVSFLLFCLFCFSCEICLTFMALILHVIELLAVVVFLPLLFGILFGF